MCAGDGYYEFDGKGIKWKKMQEKTGFRTKRTQKKEKNKLVVRDLDAINGTPVLDIKSHIGDA